MLPSNINISCLETGSTLPVISIPQISAAGASNWNFSTYSDRIYIPEAYSSRFDPETYSSSYSGYDSAVAARIRFIPFVSGWIDHRPVLPSVALRPQTISFEFPLTSERTTVETPQIPGRIIRAAIQEDTPSQDVSWLFKGKNTKRRRQKRLKY